MSMAHARRHFADARSDTFVFAPVRERSRAKSFVFVPRRFVDISRGMKSACRVLPELGFIAWLNHASPGDAREYFRGFLARDICPLSSSLRDHERRQLICVAGRAWGAAEKGLVHLVQRRIGPSEFSYIAVVRRAAKANARSENDAAAFVPHGPGRR